MTKLRARFSRNSPPTAATDLTGKTALTWMVRKADMSTKLTTEIITAAILGFEEQKRHIDTKIAELRAMLSGSPAESAARLERTPRKHKISAAARRRMAVAQRKRWARIRGECEPPAPANVPKAKRRISEEGMNTPDTVNPVSEAQDFRCRTAKDGSRTKEAMGQDQRRM